MRAFVILCLAVAAAAAQYEYVDQTAGHIGDAEDLSGAIEAAVQNDYSAAPSNGFAPGSDYDKEFFTFTAPESEFEDNAAADKIAAAVKKSLRVVFIRGPENDGLENAALQLAKSAANQRTAIYVLNKQTDIANLANQLNNLNRNNNNRPEVHFVKYRTQSDAENAQRAIQAQYDSLPGSSSSTNGGAAPVLDFASKAPLRSSISSASNSAVPSAPSAASSSFISSQLPYLPPGRRI